MVEPPVETQAAGTETIHFSRNWNVHLESTYQLASVRIGLYAIGTYIWVGLAAIPNPLTRAFGQVWVGIAFGVLFVICPILYELWVFRRWRSRRRAVSRAPIADQPDQNARIRCVGLREEFDESGELHDVNFEPQLFYAGLCAPLSPAGTLRFFIVSAVALLLIAIFRTASSVPFGFWFAAYSSLVPAGIVAGF